MSHNRITRPAPKS